MTNNSLPYLKDKAQKVFNSFIRERDKDNGCISCGSEVHHCGHYFNQKNHSALRYDEVNCNGQCIRCNNHLHGNLAHYRIGLVQKYGELEVLRLEHKAKMNRIKKWTRDELYDIIKKYS